MSDLVSLQLLSVSPIAARQALVVVDVRGHSVEKTHTAVGQYIKAGFFDDDVARPFALCNKPGTGTFELLLKLPDDKLAQLLGMQKGDRVLVGHAAGKGFPVEQAKGGSLWMFGVGSGIAPLKACVDKVLEERTAYQDVVVVYGVRDHAELAWRESYGAWAGLGVRVMPVVSGPSTAWDGKRGHVQQHLPQAFDHPSKLTAFVCGLPEMEKAVAQALLERGVGPEQVFRNW